MDAMNCQSCQAALLPTTTSKNQLVRCGGCGNTFLPQLSEKVAVQKTDRMAKWSFWLGVSSIVFCMFTGVPALILGLRSLRRMKFRVVEKKEKFQAWTGTILGLILGVFGGGCVTLVGGTVAFFASSFESSKEPARVAEMAEVIVDFNNSTEFTPSSAVSFVTFRTATFVRPGGELEDDDDDAQRNAILVFVEFHVQPDARNLNSVLRSKFIGKKSQFENSFSGETDWTAFDKPVKRDHFESKDDSGKELHRFVAIDKRDMSWFGMMLIHAPEESELSDSDIQRIFQSVNIKMFEGMPKPK